MTPTEGDLMPDQDDEQPDDREHLKPQPTEAGNDEDDDPRELAEQVWRRRFGAERRELDLPPRRS